MSLIRITGLRVVRQDKAICAVETLEVEAGARLALLGSNGTGKSTLLRVMAGLENHFDGKCVVNVPRRQRTLMHQMPYMLRGTVHSNVVYGLRARGVGKKQRDDVASKWLEQLGIAHLAGRRIGGLSGGERKRTALARALAIDPMLLLLDEPLAELDEAGAEQVGSVLASLETTTVVITSPVALPAELTTTSYRLNNSV